MAVPWNLLVGGGMSLLGTLLGKRSQDKNNQFQIDQYRRMMDLHDKERAEQQYYRSLLTPILMRNMGMRNPRAFGAMASSGETVLPLAVDRPMPDERGYY